MREQRLLVMRRGVHPLAEAQAPDGSAPVEPHTQKAPVEPRRGEMRGKSLAGYTMVELLVSLTIIGIVAGVMLPALSAARERGRQARCIGNLRQIGAAMMMYYHEWDRYPDNLDTLREAQRLPDDLFVCRSDPKRGERPESDIARGRTRPLSYKTYAILSPGTPQSALFYGLWLEKDPLAGPLVVCQHHRLHPVRVSEIRDLGAFADGHVAWCMMYVRDYGEWQDGSYWPFF